MNYKNEAQALGNAIGKLGSVAQQVGEHEDQWRARFPNIDQDSPEWQALADMKVLSVHLLEAVGQVGATVRDLLVALDGETGK